MLARLISIFWVLLLFSCTQDNQQAPNRDAYEFINAFLKRTSPPHFSDIGVLLDREELDSNFYSIQEFLEIIPRDTLFTEEDIHFITRQVHQMDSFKLSEKYVRNKKIVPVRTLPAFTDSNGKIFWERFNQQFGIDKFGTISLPVFSTNKNLVIVRINYYTSFGGGGGVYLFQKLNGDWKLLDQLDFWDN